jgi:twinkle protein
MERVQNIDLNQIDNLPTKPFRGLSQETVERFGVKVALSEQDGKTITHHYYPDHKQGKLTGYECRQVANKQFSAVGDRQGDIDLWGQHLCTPSKKLFITEGRCDAMALYQSIVEHTNDKYLNKLPAVVSLTRGAAGAAKDLTANREFVSKFDEVILCFDQDDAGKRACKDVLKVFPMAKVATLPLKDANDMLLEGRSKELYQACVWDAQNIRQGEVVDIDDDLIEKCLVKPEMGIPFPWPTVTKACFGVRPNTIHILGACPKAGKSHHEYQLISHLISLGHTVGMFDLENAPRMSALRVGSKQAKQDFTRPDREFPTEVVRNTLLSMQGKIRFYDRGASRDWSDIHICIKEMHLLDGINLFFIDPLTALISRYNASEANDKLNEIMTDMADLVNSFPITIFCYSHVNPKAKGMTPHEKGGKVLATEFTGSRALQKWAHYGHGISRDQTDDCPLEKENISELYMLFDREFGQKYKAELYYNQDTTEYLEAGYDGLHNRY